MILSDRLESIIELVTEGLVCADIGCDHGLISIELVSRNIAPFVYGMDLREGPLERARQNILEAGLQDRIQLRISNGFEKLAPGDVRTAVIAGMGGDTICGILDRTEWLFSGEYRLILQPMSRADILRYWIVHNEFVIDCEAVVKENEHIYQIICACPGKSERYSDSEYLTGKQDILHVGDEQQILLLSEWNRMKKILNGLSEAGKTDSSEFLFFNRIRMEIEESLTA